MSKRDLERSRNQKKNDFCRRRQLRGGQPHVKKMENTLREIQGRKSFDYEKSKELSDAETKIIEKELRKLGYID